MIATPLRLVLISSLLALGVRAEPSLPGITEAMDKMIAMKEVPGVVTVVVGKEGIRHLQSQGMADLASGRAMSEDTLFWIASMSKPVTGVAVLMLQDEGKLKVTDLVEAYLPEFAELKTPSGKLAKLTIEQLLTHTSGLREADVVAAGVSTLAELVPLWLSGPTQFEPGTRWKYCQSGINAAARIVEVLSGQSFDQFLEERLFAPLGMKDTGFYLSEAQRARLVTAYARQEDGELVPVAPRIGYEGDRNRPPQGNGGLYSTPRDYARFCQMLLAGGSLDGRRYLSEAALRDLTTPRTGDYPVGFFQSEAFGQYGMNYGWGIGTCVLRQPHPGAAAVLSPGSYGHGGAWGTQAWIDPAKGVAYVLMVQRSNFPNSDASPVRQAFQEAAAKTLK